MIAELQIPPARALTPKMAGALDLARKAVGQAMHQPDMAQLIGQLMIPTQGLHAKLVAEDYPVQAEHVGEALDALSRQRLAGTGECDDDTAHYEALAILKDVDGALTRALLAGAAWRTVGTVPADIYDPAERIPA